MQAPRVLETPGQGRHTHTPTPDDDPDVAPWRAGYVTCPVCHRPVRRERLERHMALLHAEAEVPADEPAVAEEEAPVVGGLRGLLARVLGRR